MNEWKILSEWTFILLFLTSITALFAFTGIADSLAPAARKLFYILLAPSLAGSIFCLLPKKKTYSKRLQIDIK